MQDVVKEAQARGHSKQIDCTLWQAGRDERTLDEAIGLLIGGDDVRKEAILRVFYVVIIHAVAEAAEG